MANEMGALDIELIKWLDKKKKKIIIKFGEEGGEIYVEDLNVVKKEVE